LVDMSVAWLGNRMVAFSEVCSIARLFGWQMGQRCTKTESRFHEFLNSFFLLSLYFNNIRSKNFINKNVPWPLYSTNLSLS
jgi:hypothetical protein